jgi:hypothetical protein
MQGTEIVSISGFSSTPRGFVPELHDLALDARALTTPTFYGNTFTLEMQNVPVVDQPRWPALDSIATPARMTFKIVWKSTGEPVKYDDSSRHFRFTGTRASCQLEGAS